ncbi:uncharacterized protein LY89DRAFT_627719 [Mollisia scopiformis]|uniref:Glycoside hydrolase family 2 protein n=1 Tax=Mollisia scopiformis TaxID=149040 RepID=A0A132BAY2_MOLSC|nr:uncharacterized protein LY89DRAFT_627719 [Mollisia scopiformis]KUJ09551.1 hypothetical protein LY89DRAFT_627719 [Mollisia scopiformis]
MDYLVSLLPARAPSQPELAQKKPPNPLSYPKSSERFSYELFKTPTSEYRGAPFWAWNTKLDKEQLLRQIDNFKDMGMGGFHAHVRTGLDTEYMGSEFMDMISACVEHAEKQEMLACLYDDDRWPSGAAGGKVIEQDPNNKGKHILFTPHLYGTIPLGGDRTSSSARACRSENGKLLASYDVELDDNGCLKSYRALKKGESGKNVWYAYMETNPSSPWFNDQTYVDSLSPAAIATFIETTHEVYKSKVGDKFGTVIPCIFTDEPQFATKTQLSNPKSGDDVFLPWTTDIPETFKEEYSADLVKGLPEVIWNLPNGRPSLTRYRYHDHVCERFVSAFMDQLSQWARKNNLMLDGHMMEEPTLHSQTTALGEAMRCYRNMDMPGMDLLVDWIEYNTAKQVSSVSRQNGTKGSMSELYGVTHWTFTFEGHKGCGDWQAALGITFRVHHLCWVSMAGEGKRDYPACIGYQSPWYEEYGYIETHFARVGVAMTRGKPVTRVGVIHPIESYWLAFGPNGSGDELGRRDQAFGDLTNWLLHALIDFDFISESLLPNQSPRKPHGKYLQVGHCQYDVVIVPNLRTIRFTTLKVLRDLAKRGGKVIIAGSAPDLIDAQVPSSPPFIDNSTSVYWSEQAILGALEQHREIKITDVQGNRAETLLHQIRQDGDERFIFICNTDRNNAHQTTVQLKGTWKVEKLDTLSGNESLVHSSYKGGWTSFPYRFEGCASLLLRLYPSKGDLLALIKFPSDRLDVVRTTVLVSLDSMTLSEPNVLMLDYAQFKLNNDGWSSPTEVLRIDNILRSRLNIPRKGAAWKQPWAVPASERKPLGSVKLMFKFHSDLTLKETTKLALEDPETMDITVNGLSIPHPGADSPIDKTENYWVDESIRTIDLPPQIITKGENSIELSFPFGILTNIERVYLLGDFGVDLKGPSGRPSLTPLKKSTLSWGDITTQLLPFYVGNVTYNCSINIPTSPTGETAKSTTTLHVPPFSSPVLTVHTSANQKLGAIALQPHTLDLGHLPSGQSNIQITAFGNRYNCFGHIHLRDGITNQCWPDIWRTEGDWWTDDYSVRPIGVLTPPEIIVEMQVEDTSASSGKNLGVEEERSRKSSDSWFVIGGS